MSDTPKAAVFAVLAAIAGAASTYVFTEIAKTKEEARRQRTEAYLSYFRAAEGDDIAVKIYTRNAVLAFGSSGVISSMANALRKSALTLVGDKKQSAVDQSTDENRNRVMAWVQMHQRIRNEFAADDPVTDRDVLTVICPDPRYTCHSVWYVKHLFD